MFITDYLFAGTQVQGLLWNHFIAGFTVGLHALYLIFSYQINFKNKLNFVLTVEEGNALSY